MVRHMPIKGCHGFPDEIINQRGIRAAPRMRWPPHKPLELIGFIINAILDLDWATTMIATARGHLFKVWVQNTSALSWTKKMARDTNPIVRCLIRLLKGHPHCILNPLHHPGVTHTGGRKCGSYSPLTPNHCTLVGVRNGGMSLGEALSELPRAARALSTLASTISSG
jgi:hypothetical protein